jgi:CheY-like chemotaxis protein
VQPDTTKVPYTLLLADDSVTIQRVIELTFADEDIDVIAVSNGDQAIERLESAPPDIVLADIGMPGKNGYEVAQYIRQSARLAHIPVVLLTGAFEPVDQALASQAGCDGVLAKPFEPQLVIGRVKELLARSSQTAQPVAVSAAAPKVAPTDAWSSPPPASAFGAASSPDAALPDGLNDYFDRLDAAFSTLTPDAPAAAAPAPAPMPPSSFEAAAPSAEIDWFGTAAGGAPASEPWDLPMQSSTSDTAADAASHTSNQSASPFDFAAVPAAVRPTPVAPPAAAPHAAPPWSPAASSPAAAATPSVVPPREIEPSTAARRATMGDCGGAAGRAVGLGRNAVSCRAVTGTNAGCSRRCIVGCGRAPPGTRGCVCRDSCRRRG